MRAVPSSILTSQTLCNCLIVQRTDGVTERFASAASDVTIAIGSGIYDGVYEAATGLDVSGLVTQAGLQVDNMDLNVFPDENYPLADVLAGLWNGAKFRLFRCDYVTPTAVDLLKRGSLGEVEAAQAGYRIELRSLKQALQQPVGAATSKTCRYRLGDAKCKVDLTPWTFVVTVTSVVSRRQFTCSGATQADDFFGQGSVTSLDGANAGYSQKVKTFAVGGVFTLSLPMPFPISVGDTLTAIAGCRHRAQEDCAAKFSNILNFGGEPHVPGADAITKDPEVVG